MLAAAHNNRCDVENQTAHGRACTYWIDYVPPPDAVQATPVQASVHGSPTPQINGVPLGVTALAVFQPRLRSIIATSSGVDVDAAAHHGRNASTPSAGKMQRRTLYAGEERRQTSRGAAVDEGQPGAMGVTSCT